MSTQSDILSSEAGAGAPLTQKHESMFRDAMRRLVRNRAAVVGGIIVIVLVTMSILAPLFAPKSYETQVLTDNNKVPAWLVTLFPSMAGYAKISTAYPLGADYVGRDLFSRILYGSRISLAVAIIAPLISMTVGATFGTISGYFGGWIDLVIQRVIEILQSLPTIPIWLAMTAALPQNWRPEQVFFAITIILSLISWTTLGREVRGRFLSLREEDFVLAADLAGCSRLRIITRHMVPAFMSHIIATSTLAIPAMIISETSLSYLGLGIRPPAISWGVLLQEAQTIQTVAQAPWLLLPGLLVIVAVLAFNLVGDGLRDAADPYGH